MPPKRPRIVPSQTNLSVQDVRDYSTPDGASMANEEMRRLKMALQQVQEQQAADVAAQQIALQPQPAQQAPEKPKETTSTYKWNVKAKAYNSQPVNNNDTVEFIGDYGIDVFAQPGRKITISAINYKWIARAGGNTIDVKYNSVLPFNGANGVVVSTQNGGILIDRPLTVYQRSIAIGDAGTIGLDFFNQGNAKPSTYTSQVFFEVQDFGGGVRRIKGWSEPGGGAGSYHWHASDGPHSHQVNNGGTVIWQGSNGVTVTLVPGIHTFTINRPLQLQQNGNNVGAPDTTTIDFDNATNHKPGTYTSQAWHEVIDNGSGHRTVKTWFAPGSGSYTWNIEASATAGTQAVVSGATVKFSGFNGVAVTRNVDDINISVDLEQFPYKPGTMQVVLFGELVFDNSNLDYISTVKPSHRYGVRKYVDIVHNWNLGNPNNFEIELMDINIDQAGVLTYYRSGNTTMSGEILSSPDSILTPPATGKVRFRNMPHVVGYDRNTVRVYATMSRNKPTEMRFRYLLRRV
jgi:hypothetical protein